MKQSGFQILSLEKLQQFLGFSPKKKKPLIYPPEISKSLI